MRTVLILAANPTSTLRLRLDEEVREIDNGLQTAKHRDQFKLVQKWAVRSRDFYRAILEHQPQIVHFCGHGAGVDGIFLEDETGQPALVEKEALSRWFKLFAVKGVECVVLNACYSEEQAQAISQYIKYVIGMNQAINDKAAIAFAVAFYDALGAGEDVEFAYNLGCAELVRLREHQTPVLKTTFIHPADIGFVAGDIPPNPYLGLSAFGEKDAAFFFGREKFTLELFQMTHQQSLVAVIGASGSGKSSVVFAGLIPKLREEGIWLIESFRPKSQPFDELTLALVRQLEFNLDGVEKVIKVGKLAESLKKGEVKLHQVVSQILEDKPNKRFLLVVDQFEELYTQCQDKEEQQRFIDILLAGVHQKSITLVFTLRADFYGYVLSYRPFRDALQQFTPQLLSSMSREELQQAISQPAQKLEVWLEDGLTERILNDVGQEPGNLPLLEFALTQLWEKQQNRMLAHSAYNEIGGVKKAASNHAENIYSQLDNKQQQRAQWIFLQLVRPGEGTEDTRRVTTRAEVTKENWELISYLAGYETRLVVTGRNESGEEIVEIVHEALIREWHRLRNWIESDRSFRTWQERLRTMKRQWEINNQDKGALLRGVLLVEAEDWLQKRPDDLIAEHEYITTSLEERKNRQQLVTITVAGLVIAAIAIPISFFWQQKLSQKTIEAVFLGTDTTEILDALPKLYKEADSFRKQVDGLKSTEDPIGYYHKHEPNMKRCFAYYRNILTATGRLQKKITEPQVKDKLQNILLKDISAKSEKALSDMLHKYRIPQLKLELSKPRPNFGKLLTGIEITHLEKRYTEGSALRMTYEILMGDSGAGADLNKDGLIQDEQEANQMPCETLREIEQLWSRATGRRCGWFGEKGFYQTNRCIELEQGKSTLYSLIFDSPIGNDAINRLQTCGIFLKSETKSH